MRSGEPTPTGGGGSYTQTPAPVPTNASWLSWIEAEFAALRYFALNGTDHRRHEEQGDAIAAYVRWRNAHAEPNTASPSTRAKVPC